MKPLHHQTPVVRLGESRVHPNADTLELFDVNNYQVVVKKGQFKAGELAIYIYPDSVVPQTLPFRFIFEPHLNGPQMCQHVREDGESSVIHKTLSDGDELHMCILCLAHLINGETSLSERRRRVTVRKFRKEYSEGLLMPLSDFDNEFRNAVQRGIAGEPTKTGFKLVFQEGQDVSDLLGITHYDPDKGVEGTKGENSNAPRRKYPRTLKGWFFFLLHKLRIFRDEHNYTEDISLQVPTYDVEALKNYRDAFIHGEEVIVTEKIHGSNARYVFFDGQMYAGSRNLWKAPKSNCVWRKALDQNPWIEKWCRAHEGYVLFGEVTPTQAGFNYGDDDVQFFAFDIRTPNGDWIKPFHQEDLTIGIEVFPHIVYEGPYDYELIKNFANGSSLEQGAKHIREGVVVSPILERRVPGLGRLQLKLVSSAFLEKDSK